MTMRQISLAVTLASLASVASAATAAPLLAQQDMGRDGTSWIWNGSVGSGGWMRVYDTNGPVRFTASPDGAVHVRATKQTHDGGDPSAVHYAVVRDGNSVTVCALWNDDATCDSQGSHGNNIHSGWIDHKQNVTVSFEVQIPRSARASANTLNGAVSVTGAGSEVNAHSVNGDIEVDDAGGAVTAKTVNGTVRVSTTAGSVNAETVNGSVHATMGSQAAGDMRFKTVNGTVDIRTPQSFNADVDLSTVNGSVNSRFALNYDRRHKRADGTVGSGGPHVEASSVNGSVSLN